MVQIRKKVTLKTKTEQEPVLEEAQAAKVQPTLHKKTPEKEPEQQCGQQPEQVTDGNESNDKGGKNKILWALAILVVVLLLLLLCCGAYYLLFSNRSGNDVAAEQVEQGAYAPSNDDEAKAENNEGAEANPESESVLGDIVANNEEKAHAVQNEAKPESPTHQAVQTQPAPVKEDVVAPELAPAPNKSVSQVDKPGAAQSVVPSGTLEQKAKDVIRGIYGNGNVRKQKLGEQYAEIQSKVNEMYRQGLVE
ncbi:MAG: hypothetical protein HUJ51_01115 [Eggerthellaceae bacterium]|nr:hypothetical protein [Eggerthellaceae bacterium]